MATINTEVSAALIKYYESLSELRELEIIRGDKVAGDIGEFIASRILGVELENSQGTRSIDGTLNGRTVQVKYSQTTEGKNINLGNPDNYDDLILVLHSRCIHFPANNEFDFVIYTIPSEVVITHFNRLENGKCTCTKNTISKIVNIQLQNLNYSSLNL